MNIKQKKKKLLVLAVIFCVVSLSCIFYNFINLGFNNFLNSFDIISSNGKMLVHFIDVGQGDAVAINLPDGKVAIIDSGPNTGSLDCVNYIKDKVIGNTNRKIIDLLIFTHADADHIGAGRKILQNFEVGNVIMPLIGKTTNMYSELEKDVDTNKIKMIDNDQILLNKEYIFEVFVDETATDTNNASYLVKIKYKSKSFLFTGDIEKKTELKLSEELGEKLDCDVLKVAHHGSTTSTCDEFLSFATPSYSVISVGKNNQYVHPHEEVIDRLNSINSKILCTDEVGDVLFVVEDSSKLLFKTGNYYITSFNLDYRIIVVFVDVVLIIVTLIVIFKKENKKQENKNK